jgi:hypothetical protein
VVRLRPGLVAIPCCGRIAGSIDAEDLTALARNICGEGAYLPYATPITMSRSKVTVMVTVAPFTASPGLAAVIR